MIFTKEEFIKNYHNLYQAEDKDQRQQANDYVIQFQKAREAWSIARELIIVCGNQPDIQFIGSSILSKKIKQEFQTLNQEQKNELKSFVFETLNDTKIILSNQTSKQLCICSAILGLYQICTTWENLIEDLIQFMKLSQRNILFGMEILESIASELGEIVLDRKVYLQTKSQLLIKQEQIYEIFNSLLILNNEDMVKNCLNCIYSWTDVNIKLQILNNFQLIKNLLNLIDNAQFQEQVFRILQEAICSSQFADMLQTGNYQQQMKLISQTEVKNIKLIIEVLVQKTQNFYQGSFVYCRSYTELVKEIAIKFPVFILEKTEYSFAILKLLLMCCRHPNRKISVITFDFWNGFKQNLKDFFKEDIKDSSNDVLLEPFLELLKIFIEKCRYQKLKIRKNNIYEYQLLQKKQKIFNLGPSEMKQQDSNYNMNSNQQDNSDDEDANICY